jgi:hypothetical protein
LLTFPMTIGTPSQVGIAPIPKIYYLLTFPMTIGTPSQLSYSPN